MNTVECPHCGKKVFTRFEKMLCGSMKSKGRVCPECGGRCVNDLSASVFSSVVIACALVYILFCYKKDLISPAFRVATSIAALVVAFVLSRLYMMLFGKLTKCIRLDV